MKVFNPETSEKHRLAMCRLVALAGGEIDQTPACQRIEVHRNHFTLKVFAQDREGRRTLTDDGYLKKTKVFRNPLPHLSR